LLLDEICTLFIDYKIVLFLVDIGFLIEEVCKKWKLWRDLRGRSRIV